MWTKLKTLLAVVLIVGGVAASTYQGIATAAGRRGANPEPAIAAAESPLRVPLPPIAGALAIIAGVALLLMDTQDFKRRATR